LAVRPLRAAAPAALALALLAVAPAQADQRIVAAPVDRYVTTAVTLAPGEALTFASQDPLAPHNVFARDTGPDGEPRFSSDTIRNGEEAPVNGVEDLDPGTYAFYCTIHPRQMNGTLTISGTPVAEAEDTTPPTLQARIDSSGLRTVERRKALRATLTADEAVGGSVTIRAFGATLARRTVSLRRGTTTVTLKLAAKALRRIRKRSRVDLTLAFSASDDAGNAATAAAKRTVRRR
jgi:plastocyanin